MPVVTTLAWPSQRLNWYGGIPPRATYWPLCGAEVVHADRG